MKDRISYAKITDEEEKGTLRQGAAIIEPTSGNTGVALSFAAAIKRYKVILTMPDTMSVERRNLVRALGAQVVLTPGKDGMKDAILKAQELSSQITNSVIPQQFENPANAAIHKKTTAKEVWKDTERKIDIFIAGIGTGGTITGVGGMPYVISGMPIETKATRRWLVEVTSYFHMEDEANRLADYEETLLYQASEKFLPQLANKRVLIGGGVVRVRQEVLMLKELGLNVVAVPAYHYGNGAEPIYTMFSFNSGKPQKR